MSIVDEDEARTELIALYQVLGLAALGLVIAGTLWVTIASERFSKEISKLKTVVNKASKGDFTNRIDVTAKDEFKDIGNDFNSMLDTLSSLLNNIKEFSDKQFQSSTSIAHMSDSTANSLLEVGRGIGQVTYGDVD